MSKMIPIIIFSMIMVYLSHLYSGYDPIEGKYHHKEWVFYTIMTIGMIIYAGMRTYYNDTTTYLFGYNQLAEDPKRLENLEWFHLGTNPGFTYAQGLLLKMNAIPQTFLLVFSIISVGVSLWFFRKYSCNLWLTLLLYITFAGFTFSLAAIKQCTAMAFCLIATDRAIQKKYIWFLFFVLLAATFHPYALMYLIVPFLFFRPWSKNTVVMLIVFGMVGFCMESLLGTLLNVTDMLGENYNAASFMGEGVNPLRLLVTLVPAVLALLTSEQIWKNEERDQYMIVNLAMLNAEIMFVALFGTANYFARLANYFIPFQAVAIPYLLKQYDRRGRRTMTLLTVIGFSLFFIYNHYINERFDAFFYRRTFWNYLSEVFKWGEYR